ncbi:hypothetical protein DOTSEDRAFT_49429 [Dothistroma septosporum NZE10]|uniref:Lytic polysaccharide monooxygenase n=1 Tax=Dothistroma septosporum (strain NZE10 / CBS 128990) TaxID=675120 RepID=N1Q381_DOTSN|nr:hypothetical protein DOTSEDRAFT_49429 [Dothistroma septosporum NZE10]
MTLSLSPLACIAMLFSSTAVAHMTINSPVPFGQKTLTNSPLASDGSDFPCKQRSGVYDITAMNKMAVGEPQTLNFTGEASHGGGTCQLAISMDKEPSKDSVWKLIQVFEGGCPVSADGNAGSHPFTFSIPKDFPNGISTFSWIWFNRIGNREIYMNCAPITVTGGSDSKDAYDSLPDAYFVNLDDTCKTQDSADTIIPYPGEYVLKDSTNLKSATGSGCAAKAAAQTSGVKDYKSATVNDGGAYSAEVQTSTPAQTSAPAPTEARSTSAATSAASPSSEAPAYTSALTATIPVAVTSYATMTVSSGAGIFGPASTAGSAAAPVGTGSSSSFGSSTGECSSDGEVICNGTSQFGICNHGNVVYQAVAAGTQCKDGSIMKRSDSNVHVRRNAQHVRKHQV